MSAPRTKRSARSSPRSHPSHASDHTTSARRELGETLKKVGIWAFIFIFLTSILGVAFISVSAR